MVKLTPYLQDQGIALYSKPSAFIFVQADDPDGACQEALKKIKDNILTEKDNSTTRDIVINLNKEARVVKIRKLSHV